METEWVPRAILNSFGENKIILPSHNTDYSIPGSHTHVETTNKITVLTCISLCRRLLFKVEHRTVTLTSRASIALTRMRAHYVVGGTVYISHCNIVASFVIVPRSCA
jgi:hypothetical protein